VIASLHFNQVKPWSVASLITVACRVSYVSSVGAFARDMARGVRNEFGYSSACFVLVLCALCSMLLCSVLFALCCAASCSVIGDLCFLARALGALRFVLCAVCFPIAICALCFVICALCCPMLFFSRACTICCDSTGGFLLFEKSFCYWK
jgi:hypothetical protein